MREVVSVPAGQVASGSPLAWHLVLRAIPGLVPFESAADAWWLLVRLREGWKTAYACCLMPTHVHILVPAGNAEAEREKLRRVASGYTQHRGRARLWRSVDVPTEVRDRLHLQRCVAYAHANPCRSKLVDDPLLWEYSTHRGLVGATVDPWVTPKRLAVLIGRRALEDSNWWHRYTSNHSDVSDAGRMPLGVAETTDVPVHTLTEIVRAVRAATPWNDKALKRHGIVLLAYDQGWRNAEQLGALLGLTPKWVRELSRRPNPELLHAAKCCLFAARLRYRPSTLVPGLAADGRIILPR